MATAACGPEREEETAPFLVGRVAGLSLDLHVSGGRRELRTSIEQLDADPRCGEVEAGLVHPEPHRAGVAALLRGEPACSVELLRQAREAAPGDGAVLNDLSAALLEKARGEESARDLLRAAESALAALKVEPDSLAARFNLAQALATIGLAEDARREWAAYRAAEEDRAWCEEGDRRLRQVRDAPGDLPGRDGAGEASPTLESDREDGAGELLFRQAVEEYHSLSYGEAVRTAVRAATCAAEAGQDSLLGHAKLLLGNIAQIRGDPVGSIPLTREAWDAFRRAGEVDQARRAAAQMSTAYDSLGDPEEAWKWWAHSLEEGLPRSFLAGMIVYETGNLLALGDGMPEIALLLQDHAVAVARDPGKPVGLPGALLRKAETLRRLGRLEEARQVVAEAGEAVEKISESEPETARVIEGDRLLMESRLFRKAQPGLALERLEQAIENDRMTSYEYRETELRVRRAELLQRLNRPREAETALTEALRQAEDQRGAIPLARRSDFFETLRRAVELQVTLRAVAFGDAEAALEAAERSKARTLLDHLRTVPSGDTAVTGFEPEAVLGPAAARSGLPPKTRVISYFVTEAETFAWVFGAEGGIRQERLPLSRRELSAWVEQARREISGGAVAGSRQGSPASDRLYRALIAPWEQPSADFDRLLILPDGPLHALPFAVLTDSAGRRLIEKRPLLTAPALGVYVTSLRRDRRLAADRRAAATRILVVEQPDFTGWGYELPRLQATGLGAAVREIFPGSSILQGAEATRQAFLRQVGEYEAAHFGGHAVPNRRLPLYSSLLFSSSPDDPSGGVLYARDVLEQSFGKTRLVVLAGCETAVGRVSGEGVESLARSFQAAGVPAVAASLWKVDEQPTALFFERLYRNLAGTSDLAAAFQRTQLELLDEVPDRASTWGAFVLIGASSTEVAW